MEDTDIQLVEKAFMGLRERFCEGSVIGTQEERERIEECLEPLSLVWNAKSPNFPPRVDASPTFRELMRRGVRDAYLKQLIRDTLMGGGRVLGIVLL